MFATPPLPGWSEKLTPKMSFYAIFRAATPTFRTECWGQVVMRCCPPPLSTISRPAYGSGNYTVCISQSHASYCGLLVRIVVDCWLIWRRSLTVNGKSRVIFHLLCMEMTYLYMQLMNRNCRAAHSFIVAYDYILCMFGHLGLTAYFGNNLGCVVKASVIPRS